MVNDCLTSVNKVRKQFNVYNYLIWISTLGAGDLLTDPRVTMTHPYISFVFCFNFFWMLIQVEIHLDPPPRTEISRPTYLVKEMSMQHLMHLLVTISASYIMIASGSSRKSFRWLDVRYPRGLI